METKILKIQEYLSKHGLEKTLKTFSLKSRVYPNKILLKYDQLVSPTIMSLKEVQECRGLILELNTWKVMCMSFDKFFNSGESNAAKINWNTAHVLEKLDGTMIQVYWDWFENKWFAATTGTAEGEGEVNNKMGTTFNDLFWETVNLKYSFNQDSLNKDFVYVFELTTPYNIVVKPHGESSATLLTIRNRVTLNECSRNEVESIANTLNVPLVKAFDINANNVGEIMRTFDGMVWSEEGYVVVDGEFNRIKVKNPAYVAVHHLKGKTAEHNILTIVKANELEEFSATFPERTEELLRLKTNYDLLTEKLNLVWDELKVLKPKNITKEEQKRYATAVFSVTKNYGVEKFTGLYFGLAQYKIASVEEFLMNYDDKLLYKIL